MGDGGKGGSTRQDPKEPEALYEDLLIHVTGFFREPEAFEALEPTIALDATKHHVDGDPIRLRQVFANLLKNAVKFTPPGGRIGLRSWNHASTVMVEVSDTGEGIDPEALGRVFGRFEQARAPKATGGDSASGWRSAGGSWISTEGGSPPTARGGDGAPGSWWSSAPSPRPRPTVPPPHPQPHPFATGRRREGRGS